MPLYEYRCTTCRRKSTLLTLRASEQVVPVCEHCGSTDMTRLMSRFALGRSENSRMESLSDPSQFAGLDESDPKSMARWMRKMGRELGEDAGADFDSLVDEMEQGGDDDSADGSGGEGDL